MLLQVNLNSEKKTLLFDLGTLEHIGDLIGGDGFAFVVNIKEYAHFRKDLSTIICAGLRSYYDSVERPYDFEVKDVDKWTKRIANMGEAISILAAFHNAFKTEIVSVEGNADTRGQISGHVEGDHDRGDGRVRVAS